MSETQSSPLQEQILSTLNQCILKMSDRLLKTFNPEDKSSLALFKQFCSALNARRIWLKNEMKSDEKPDKKKESIQHISTGKSNKSVSSHTWLEQKLSEPNPNHPIKPEQRANGLLCR